MKVKEARPGQIIETLTSGNFPTGNIYKVEGQGFGGKIKCRKRFTREAIDLAPDNNCRVLTRLVDGF